MVRGTRYELLLGEAGDERAKNSGGGCAALTSRAAEPCNPSALAAADHPTARRPIRRANMSLADQWARLCAELQCSGAVRAKGDEMLTRLTDDRLESSQARLAA